MLIILACYGIPDSLNQVSCYSVSPYKSVTIKFIRGKNEHGFPSFAGVKQGDNLVPILILFSMQAAVEALDSVWSEYNIEAPISFMRDPDDNDGSINAAPSLVKVPPELAIFSNSVAHYLQMRFIIPAGMIGSRG